MTRKTLRTLTAAAVAVGAVLLAGTPAHALPMGRQPIETEVPYYGPAAAAAVQQGKAAACDLAPWLYGFCAAQR